MSPREVVRVSECVGCAAFPCQDVNHKAFVIPEIAIRPEDISIVMISEAAPAAAGDYFYAPGNPAFAQTTLQVFSDAGAKVPSIKDLTRRGVYLTTAVKCGKTAYGIAASTIKQCSLILEREINLFPTVKVYLLMGDVAIQALNYISVRAGVGRTVPGGATYKLRGRKYLFRGARVFPSYLQVGPSFNIEKSKRRMIAEDIASALRLLE